MEKENQSWLSAIKSERSEQIEKIKEIYPHFPDAYPLHQYLNGLLWLAKKGQESNYIESVYPHRITQKQRKSMRNKMSSRIKNLEEMLPEDRIKLVFMWIKQGVLSYKEFSKLVNSGELTKPQLIEE